MRPLTTELERVIILGDILDLAAAFLATNNAAVQRYLTPVQTLQTAADQDLKPEVSCELPTPFGRTSLPRPTAIRWAPKTVGVNVYYLDEIRANPNLAAIDTIVNPQISTASISPAFQGAQVVNRTNANATLISETAAHEWILLTNPPAPPNMAGKLQDSTTGSKPMMTVLNAAVRRGRGRGVLPEYDQNDIQGRAFRVGQKYNGIVTQPADRDHADNSRRRRHRHPRHHPAA